MGYCDNPAMVRVDFFKESGKWYTTESIRWLHYDHEDIHASFLESLREHLLQKDGTTRLQGMTAVCLSPYHKNAFPLMKQIPMFT